MQDNFCYVLNCQKKIAKLIHSFQCINIWPYNKMISNVVLSNGKENTIFRSLHKFNKLSSLWMFIKIKYFACILEIVNWMHYADRGKFAHQQRSTSKIQRFFDEKKM